MKNALKRLVVGFSMFTLGMMVLSQGYAQVPQLINYQAVIKNQSNSQTVPDGNYQITYRIYTTLTGGGVVWSEATTDTVASGVLNHVLGSVSTLSVLPTNVNYYLTIQLNGDSEMSPRELLTSVGSSIVAGSLSAGATWYGTVTGYNTSDAYVLFLNNTSVGGLYSSASDYGVVGYSNYSTEEGAGVYGQGYFGVWGYSDYLGVYGEGDYYGVYGYGDYEGVYGEGEYGVVGYNDESGGTGIYGGNEYAGGWGVFGYSDYTGGYGVEGDGYYGSIGVKGYSDSTTAIYGESGSTTVFGIGVKGVADGFEGVGVWGSSTGNDGYGVVGIVNLGLGVLGESSSNGIGVAGVTFDTTNEEAAVIGEAPYFSTGVLGESGSSNGVYGSSNDTTGDAVGYGAVQSGHYAGVFGQNLSGYGIGVFGRSTGYEGTGVYGFTDNGFGVWAQSTASEGWAIMATATNGGDALHVYSNTGKAISVDSGASYFKDIYINGTEHTSVGIAGDIIGVMKNTGTDNLELGDVVVIKGNSPAVLGEIPVTNVAKTSKGYDSGVIGIVDSFVQITTTTQSHKATEDANRVSIQADKTRQIKTGDYIHVITHGEFKAIKVDATYGAINPGDLLTTSPNPGYAMKVTPKIIDGETFYPNGCIIGKSLGSLESGQGSVPIFVVHQ
jgi:hypothetical protein